MFGPLADGTPRSGPPGPPSGLLTPSELVARLDPRTTPHAPQFLGPDQVLTVPLHRGRSLSPSAARGTPRRSRGVDCERSRCHWAPRGGSRSVPRRRGGRRSRRHRSGYARCDAVAPPPGVRTQQPGIARAARAAVANTHARLCHFATVEAVGVLAGACLEVRTPPGRHALTDRPSSQAGARGSRGRSPSWRAHPAPPLGMRDGL